MSKLKISIFILFLLQFNIVKGNHDIDQILLPEDISNNDLFGFDTAMEGNFLAVSAHKRNNLSNNLNQCGGVYIYELIADQWQHHSTLFASDQQAYDHFGFSLDMNEGRLVISAPEHDLLSPGNDTLFAAGAVYVFELNGDNSWQENYKLTASDATSVDHFGYSVAIDSIFIAIGAPHKFIQDSIGENKIAAGAAYIFEFSNNNWQEVEIVNENTPENQREFGLTLDIYRNTLIVGAPTTLSISQNRIHPKCYHFGFSNNQWELIEVIETDFWVWNFGKHIEVFKDYLFITGTLPSNENRLHIYSFTGYNTVDLVQMLTEDDTEGTLYGHKFGEGLAFFDNYLILAGEKVNSGYYGIDYIGQLAMFEKTNTDSFLFKKPIYLPEYLQLASNFDLGWSLSTNGTDIAIGIPQIIGVWRDGEELIDAGIVYNYKFDQTTFIDDLSETSYKLKISPNPARDFIHLETDIINTQHIVSIYDLQGYLMKQINYQENNRLAIHDLNPGTYLVQIQKDDQIFSSGKFIKL